MDHKALFDRVTGTDTGAYREEHLGQSIDRTVRTFGISSFASFLERLDCDQMVSQRFRRSFFIGITSAYRDIEEFHDLERALREKLEGSDGFARIWSAGCSSGDELASVYDMMISRGLVKDGEFIGSDVSDEAINVARRSNQHDRSGNSESPLKFMVGDLLKEEGPKGDFDLILCRNVSIYLKNIHRDRVISFLFTRLSSNGLLMLGRSEFITKPGDYGLERLTRSLYKRTS